MILLPGAGHRWRWRAVVGMRAALRVMSFRLHLTVMVMLVMSGSMTTRGDADALVNNWGGVRSIQWWRSYRVSSRALAYLSSHPAIIQHPHHFLSSFSL